MSEHETMFDEQYLDGLPDSLALAAGKICDDFFKMDNDIRNTGEMISNHFDDYIDAWHFIKTFCVAAKLQLDTSYEIDLHNKEQSINVLRVRIEKLKLSVNELQKTGLSDRIRTRFNPEGIYEFSGGDLEIIQRKINELRDLISNIDMFDDDFKSRLLKRLESLQIELHKRMSNLDLFWGLFGDAGVAMGRFGNDAKPLFDRVREILEIVWRTQARAEELPSDSPLPQLEDKA